MAYKVLKNLLNCNTYIIYTDLSFQFKLNLKMEVIDTNVRSVGTNMTEPVKAGCDVSSQMDYSVNTENKENQTEHRVNKRHEEYQYLEKVAEIMKYGNTRIDRTNVGTKSIFGAQARYSLRNSN